MANDRTKRISDGNGGEIEVDISTAVICERLKTIDLKIDGLNQDVAEVKSTIDVLFKKHDDLVETIHRIDKETAVVKAKSEENTETRKWTLRGLIGAILSATIGGLMTWVMSHGGNK